MEQLNNIPARHFKTRKAWRQWLQENHATAKAVWLILHHRKSNAPGIYMDEAVEEALCFGWIDSKAVKRDAESRYQYFSPRKSKSNWSKVNRERADRLIREGLMAPAGQALIDLAKRTGTWEAMVDVENEVIPPDLQRSFDKNKTALKNFQAFSPSSKRVILQWIMSARKEDTRSKRIAATVAHAARNEKAYP